MGKNQLNSSISSIDTNEDQKNYCNSDTPDGDLVKDKADNYSIDSIDAENYKVQEID